MKRETGIIVAAGISLLAVLGFIGLRRFLNARHEEYLEDYADFHRNFEGKYRNEDHHGVEYLAMN